MSGNFLFIVYVRGKSSKPKFYMVLLAMFKEMYLCMYSSIAYKQFSIVEFICLNFCQQVYHFTIVYNTV